MLCSIFFLTMSFNAQDRVYLLDGQRLDGLVTEINEEYITLLANSVTQQIRVNAIVLIEFRNGRTEVFNEAPKDVFVLNSKRPHNTSEKDKIAWQNECYINTLALFNADLSLYYEYRLRAKPLGLGVLCTYNFNHYATLPNVFIGILSNGKKRYDAGAFINFYTGGLNPKHKLYYGLIMKYTAFDFTAVIEDSIYSNNTVSVLVSYEETSASQLSFLFNLGSHHNIADNLFIKSSFAFGFFRLKGVYKEQLNYVLRNPETGEAATYSLLPKASIGLCVGLKF